MRLLLLLFVVVPLLELYLLVWVGTWIGFWPTVALTLVTGTLGAMLARREGLKVWHAWRASLAALRPPEQGVIDGVLVLIGGTLLIAPGVISDVTGLLLLLPWTRRRAARAVGRIIERRLASGSLRILTIQQRVGPDPGFSASVVETTGKSVDEQRDRDAGAQRTLPPRNP